MQQGFTLLELLVVLVIIGLMTAATMLNVDLDGDGHVRSVMHLLQDTIELAQEEAEVTGHSFALGFWQHGWRFYVMDRAETWRPVTNEHFLRPRHIDDGVQLNLQLQNIAVVLPPKDETKPQIFLLPSGEMQPFILEVAQQGQGAERLSGNAIGHLHVHEER